MHLKTCLPSPQFHPCMYRSLFIQGANSMCLIRGCVKDVEVTHQLVCVWGIEHIIGGRKNEWKFGEVSPLKVCERVVWVLFTKSISSPSKCYDRRANNNKVVKQIINHSMIKKASVDSLDCVSECSLQLLMSYTFTHLMYCSIDYCCVKQSLEQKIVASK